MKTIKATNTISAKDIKKAVKLLKKNKTSDEIFVEFYSRSFLEPTFVDDVLLCRKVEQLGLERARWIDKTIEKNIPKWKADILLKYPHRILARILNINIDIINQQLIADFGTQVIIKLNNKVIGKRKYKY